MLKKKDFKNVILFIIGWILLCIIFGWLGNNSFNSSLPPDEGNIDNYSIF